MDASLPLPTFLTGSCLPIKTRRPKKIQDRIDDWFAIVETRKMEAKVVLDIQNTYLGSLDQLVKCADRIPNKKGKWCKRCRGSDFLVVMRYGNIVRKFRELDRFHDDKIDQLLGHNYLFWNKTPYRIEGWTIRKNFQGETPIIVLQQPFIKFCPNSGAKARSQLSQDLESRFGSISKLQDDGDWVIAEEGLRLDDLKDANIGIEQKTGMYAVVDCIVHKPGLA